MRKNMKRSKIDYVEMEGEKIKYKTSTKIELKNLPDGEYLQSVIIVDQRYIRSLGGI